MASYYGLGLWLTVRNGRSMLKHCLTVKEKADKIQVDKYWDIFLPSIHVLHDSFQVGPCYTMNYCLTRTNTSLSLQI